MEMNVFFTFLLAVNMIIAQAIGWNTAMKAIVIGNAVILLGLIVKKLIRK